jgi:hypothetical protein
LNTHVPLGGTKETGIAGSTRQLDAEILLSRICFRDLIPHPPPVRLTAGMPYGGEFEPDTNRSVGVGHFDHGDAPVPLG